MVNQITNTTNGSPIATYRKNTRHARSTVNDSNCQPDPSQMSTGLVIIGFISGFGLGIVLHIVICMIWRGIEKLPNYIMLVLTQQWQRDA